MCQHGLLSMESQCLQGFCSCLGFPWVAAFFQGISTCCDVGFTTSHGVDVCTNVVLHELQTVTLLHHFSLHRLQENPVLAPGAPPLFPLSPTIMAAVLFLSHCFLTFLSHSCMAALFTFFKKHFPGGATTLAARLSCVLWWGHWSWLEPAVSSTGQPLLLLIEATPQLPHRQNFAK